MKYSAEQIKDILENAPNGSQFYTDGYDVKYRKVIGDKYFGYLDEAKDWVETCDKQLSQERIDKGLWLTNLIKERENQMNIDNLAIQTPEEKEALDTMTGISREHLMSMINQQSEIIKELSEKLNTSELPNGSNEIIKPLWAKWSIGDSVTKTKGSSWTGKVVGYYQTDLTSKGYAVESETEKGSVQIYPEAALCSVETEAGRVERERLEAAYDLFCVWSDGATPCSFDVFVNGTIGNSKRRFLAIVDKTNYRKESN